MDCEQRIVRCVRWMVALRCVAIREMDCRSGAEQITIHTPAHSLMYACADLYQVDTMVCRTVCSMLLVLRRWVIRWCSCVIIGAVIDGVPIDCSSCVSSYLVLVCCMIVCALVLIWHELKCVRYM